TFEKAFIKKFIPDLWEMMEAVEDAHREEIQEVKLETDEDSMTEKLQVQYVEKEIDSGSLKNSSEQSDRKFPATITMAPSVMKNHMAVVDEILENNDESKDDQIKVVIEASTVDGEGVRIKESDSGPETIVTAMVERLEAVNSEVSVKTMNEVYRRIEQVVALEPPPEPPVSDQPVVARPRRAPPPRPPGLHEFVDGERYKAENMGKKGKEQTAWDGLPSTAPHAFTTTTYRRVLVSLSLEKSVKYGVRDEVTVMKDKGGVIL
ncbi:hypothetical protein A2U01_0027784, partial [Trifolium medium]|nr:hypothetical protein [Trifolium medium]